MSPPALSLQRRAVSRKGAPTGQSTGVKGERPADHPKTSRPLHGLLPRIHSKEPSKSFPSGCQCPKNGPVSCQYATPTAVWKFPGSEGSHEPLAASDFPPSHLQVPHSSENSSWFVPLTTILRFTEIPCLLHRVGQEQVYSREYGDTQSLFLYYYLLLYCFPYKQQYTHFHPTLYLLSMLSIALVLLCWLLQLCEELQNLCHYHTPKILSLLIFQAMFKPYFNKNKI